ACAGNKPVNQPEIKSGCCLPSFVTGVTGRVRRLCGQRRIRLRTEPIIWLNQALGGPRATAICAMANMRSEAALVRTDLVRVTRQRGRMVRLRSTVGIDEAACHLPKHPPCMKPPSSLTSLAIETLVFSPRQRYPTGLEVP